ncbi:MAG: hypothetical protein R2719_03725 [Micropruina sp.]
MAIPDDVDGSHPGERRDPDQVRDDVAVPDDADGSHPGERRDPGSSPG